MRISRALVPVKIARGAGHTLRNFQCLNSGYGLNASGMNTSVCDITILNGLFADIEAGFYCNSPNTVTIRGEQVTLKNFVNYLGINVAPTLVNSLIVEVQPIFGPLNATLIDCAISPTAVGVFAQSLQGGHYLPLDSPYRNQGGTSINSQLAAELRQLTTEAPLQLVGPITVDTTLYPRVRRDTDQPDLGAHFAPLDYYGNNVVISGGTLRLRNGVAIAGYRPGLFTVTGTGQLDSQGRPDNLNHLTSYATVQEMDTFPPYDNTLNTPDFTMIQGGNTTLRFTDVAFAGGPQNCRQLFYPYFPGLISLRDSLLRGAYWKAINTGGNSSLGIELVNCLMEDSQLDISQGNPSGGTGGTPYYLPLKFRNCLATRSIIDLKRSTTANGNWTIVDNLFDQSTGSLTYFTGGTSPDQLQKNGYSAKTLPANAFLGGINNKPDLIRDFVNGPLGSYYYPTVGVDPTAVGAYSLASLLNQGTVLAKDTTVGLNHYTTQANGPKEGSTQVDIGFHYTATGQNTGSQTWDSSAGFSTTQGNNGWSYNYVPEMGMPSQRQALTWGPNVFWGSTPSAWNAPSGDPYCGIRPGSMHPGWTFDPVLSFQIPSSGNYSINAVISDGDPQVPSTYANGVNVRLLKGDTDLVSPGPIPGMMAPEGFANFPISTQGQFQQGDFVHLQLNRNAFNSYDTTTVSLQIVRQSGQTVGQTFWDTDSDGIPDYLEDKNGNGNMVGAPDPGETDWNTYNSANAIPTGTVQIFTKLY